MRGVAAADFIAPPGILLNLALIATSALLVCAAACYVFLRPITYSILDPVMVLSAFMAFSAPLLSVLCATGLVPWSKFSLFAVVLLTYLVGARLGAARFNASQFRKRLVESTGAFSRSEVKALLLLTIFFTLALAFLGILFGASGDARQQFGREFRPLVLIHHGLFLIALVLLLSRRFSFSRALIWVTTTALIAIPFSGKSVLLPVIYWIGLRLFIDERRVTLRTISLSLLLIVIGVGIMAIIAYGKASLTGIFFLLGYRLWMSGDVYIYAYQLHGLAALRGHYHVSFIPYILHPITALIGVRAYNRPLGAALASQIVGTDVLTGPNPNLPVLLDFFFHGSVLEIAPVALAIGYLVLGIRPVALALQGCRTRFVRLGVLVAAIFAPSPGFLDESQVLIGLIGIVAVSAMLTLLDLTIRSSLPQSHTIVDRSA